MIRSRVTNAILLACALALGACDSDPIEIERSFIEGTEDDPQIGVVVNTTGNAVRLFQLGNPAEVREIALGASSAVTPTGLSIHEGLIAVPLGNAASVAIIDAASQRIERFFLFPSGNATGSAFAADGALLVANLIDDEVGRVTLDQAGDDIADRVSVTPAPTDIEVSDGRALVLSGNLDESFAPLGEGIVTAVDPATLDVLGTVETGGDNPTASAVGPDGLLYVVNTGDYVGPASLAIIDPATLERVDLVDNIGVGAGAITIDGAGLAHISGFGFGTVVFDTQTKTLVRGPEDPVCAALASGECRGAFDAAAASDGRLYQAFLGSAAQGLAPWIFVYAADSYALTDSIESGPGPATIRIATFEP